jgi:hypothetical protein
MIAESRVAMNGLPVQAGDETWQYGGTTRRPLTSLYIDHLHFGDAGVGRVVPAKTLALVVFSVVVLGLLTGGAAQLFGF